MTGKTSGIGLVIGPDGKASKQQADYQSAAGCHPAPHKNVQKVQYTDFTPVC